MKITLSKDAAWHEARRKAIGGSDAGAIMSGDWLDLWEVKTGRREPEDLSGKLPVAMGTWTEELNRYWYELQTGDAVVVPEHASVDPAYPFLRANLDGLVFPNIVFEAKHVNAFTKDDELVRNYFPQLQHQMVVTGSPLAHLSVFFGNNRWSMFAIARDSAYAERYLDRARTFWGHVERDEPPPSMSDATAAITLSFDEMREVDMTGQNAWSNYAHDWLELRTSAKRFDEAVKEIKELVEPDVRKAFGHGVIATRSKAGAITIKEMH